MRTGLDEPNLDYTYMSHPIAYMYCPHVHVASTRPSTWNHVHEIHLSTFHAHVHLLHRMSMRRMMRRELRCACTGFNMCMCMQMYR